jgi:hypothetical protein
MKGSLGTGCQARKLPRLIRTKQALYRQYTGTIQAWAASIVPVYYLYNACVLANEQRA